MATLKFWNNNEQLRSRQVVSMLLTVIYIVVPVGIGGLQPAFELFQLVCIRCGI